VAQFLTTQQVLGDGRFAVGAPAPPHACQRTPHALTGVGPDWGLAGAFAPRWRCLSGLAPWRPPVRLLLPSAEHLDGLTLAVVLRGGRPAPPPPGMDKEALESCGALADGSETSHGGLPRP
jgi:hypothetical protein